MLQECEVDNELFTLNNQDIAAADDLEAIRRRRLDALKYQRKQMETYKENVRHWSLLDTRTTASTRN